MHRRPRATRPRATGRRAGRLRALGLCLIGLSAVVLTAAPAGAQQLVDAGAEGDGSGGLAFVLMTVLVFFIGASLFFMDRVRRRREDQEPS